MSVSYVGFFGYASGAPVSVPATTQPYGPPLCPLVTLSVGNPAVSIAAAIDGLIALQAQLTITPPTLTLILDALVEFQAQCTAALGVGLPTVSFDLTASAQLVANLTLSLTLLIALEALLALPVSVSWLGVPYPVPGSALGVAAAGLPPTLTGTPNHALVLAAVDVPLLTSTARTNLEGFCGGVSFPGAGVFSNLADLTPVCLNAIAEARAGIEYQLGLALKLDAFVKVNPPTFTASIKATAAFAASLRAAAALALPSISFQFKAIARILADLQARFGLLYLLGQVLRPDGAVFVYRWDDTGPPGFGTELTTKLASSYDPPPDGPGLISSTLPCEAVMFGSADAVTWTALVDSASGALFGGAHA